MYQNELLLPNTVIVWFTLVFWGVALLELLLFITQDPIMDKVGARLCLTVC